MAFHFWHGGENRTNLTLTQREAAGRRGGACAASFLKLFFRDDSSEFAALVSHATSLRPGHSCSVIKKSISKGSYNILLRIEFDDSIPWVARLVLPQSDPHLCQDDSIDTDSEVAAMLYLTHIPPSLCPKCMATNPILQCRRYTVYVPSIHRRGTLFWKMKDP
jgi:hypothetical protein